MQYELKTPYLFPVVGSHYDEDNRLMLDVEINDQTFPVFGYEPQVRNGLPKEIQCRFLKDSFGTVYLRQDVEPLFSLLYANGHKCLLEVVDRPDPETLKVRDKYGISHYIKVDGKDEYCLNEILIRYAYFSESGSFDFEKEPLLDPNHDILLEKCGIQEEIECEARNHTTSNIVDKENNVPSRRTLSEILRGGDKTELENYICEFKGAKIPLLHIEIKNYIENECREEVEYCQSISDLINHNAALFLGVIASSDSSRLKCTNACVAILDKFLPKMLNVPDKIHHVFKILLFFRGKLTESQKTQIYIKSSFLNNPELYKLLFNLVEADSNLCVDYLLNSAKGLASKYAIYLFYEDAKKRGQLKTSTPIESLRVSSVRKTADMLSKGDEIDKCVSALIYRNILGYEAKIDNRLLRAVKDKGFDGFKSHFKNISAQRQHKQAYAELVERKQEYEFKPIRRLDNHYLLFHIPSNSYALLPISLAERPISISHPKPVKAFIYKKYADINLLLIYQKKQTFFFRQPPIVEKRTKLNVHFVNIGGKWLPVVDNYAKFIKIRILNMQVIDDFKAKYVVSIENPVDFLTYKAIVVEKL